MATAEELRQEIEALEADLYGSEEGQEESAPEPIESEPDQPEEVVEDTQEEPTPESSEESQAQHQDDDVINKLEKRIADGQRKITQISQENSELRRQLDALTRENEHLKQQQAAEPKQDAYSSLDELSDEYEMMEPVVAQLKAKDEQIAQMQQQLEQLAQGSQETQQQMHFNMIRSAHPDAEQIATSDSFQVYLAQKDSENDGSSPLASQIVQSGTAVEIIQLLSDYKQSQQVKPRPTNIEAARQAVTPKPKSQVVRPQSKPTFTREQIAAMSPAEFKANEEAIMDAMASGRI